MVTRKLRKGYGYPTEIALIAYKKILENNRKITTGKSCIWGIVILNISLV